MKNTSAKLKKNTRVKQFRQTLMSNHHIENQIFSFKFLKLDLLCVSLFLLNN